MSDEVVKVQLNLVAKKSANKPGRSGTVGMLVFLALSVSGCSQFAGRASLSMDPKETSLPDIKKPFGDVGNGYAAVDYVGLSFEEELVVTPAEISGAIPVFKVGAMSYTNLGLYDVIQSLLKYSDKEIALSFESGDEKLSPSNVISGFNIKGKFEDVLESLSATNGFFYQYKNGQLSIKGDRQFIVTLPPVSELFESIPSVLGSLGAGNVLLDKSARLVTFRASRNVYEKIDNYLSYIRKNRSLITYDCYIWEVGLNDSSQMGINWRSLPTSGPKAIATSGAAVTSENLALTLESAGTVTGGTGVGMAIKAGNFALNVLLDFLKSQGTVNNVSQPKISLLSGSAAQFRNGQSITYVSKVSPGALSNGTWLSGSADTAILQTGITMTIAGDVSGDTVFTDMSLKIADLVRMDTAQVAINQGASTTISLPVSSDKEVSARLRSRPGDAVIVGGINIQKQSNAQSGIGSLATSSNKSAERSEMVVVLIPRITHFVRRPVAEVKRAELEVKPVDGGKPLDVEVKRIAGGAQ